jgi:hypothetical protein
VVQVQRMLGHSKPSVTLDRYAAELASKSKETDERLDAVFRAFPATASQGALTPGTPDALELLLPSVM